MGGVFGSVGFYVAGGRVGVKREFANLFHPQRAPAFGPLPDGIYRFARTPVIGAFPFKILKNSLGFIRRLKPKQFMVVRIPPRFAVFGFLDFNHNGEASGRAGVLFRAPRGKEL